MLESAHNPLEGDRPEMSIKLHQNTDDHVSIIVVHKDRPEYLNICLQSIAVTSFNNNYEIIVVDNGSGKESQEFLKDIEGEVKVVRNEKNYELAFSVGFFFGQNTTALSKREWDFGGFGEALINKPSRLAGLIVFEIYASGFGFVSENPPYLKKGDDGAWVINEELYKKNS